MARGPAGDALHLVRRFVGSLRPGPPRPDDEAWALDWLNPGERELWARMSNPDRRHAVEVARAVVAQWPEAAAGPEPMPAEPGRPEVAAALLHDVGKVDAQLRTPARVVATLVWAVLDDETAARWADVPDPVRRRLGRYRRHPAIGAELLRAAGADPVTVAWAAEHHRPERDWTVPAGTGRLLKDCDDD